MPKKKQVTLQNSIPGKFIPRNVPPTGSAFPSSANDNRFNAKMAELLASSSSSPINNENELVSTKSSQDNSILSEIISNDSSRIPSKLLHRRIVTMLETMTKSDDDDNSSKLSSTSSHIEYKSQPITFGQLRQGTISSVPVTITDDKSVSSQLIIDNQEKHYKTLTTFSRDNHSDLTLTTTTKSSSKHQTHKEKLHYSPSLEKLFEQQNIIPQTKKIDEQTQKSSLTVDEILATYYSKINATTNTQSHLLSSPYPNSTSTSFYMHPSVSRSNSSHYNQYTIPAPRLMLNEQNRNRPPPPSYSSSIANGHRMTSTISNPAQNLLRPSVSSSILESFYPNFSTSSLSNNSIRPPPPRYQSPISNIEHSHSIISSINDSSTSIQQSSTIINNISTGYDREFSRLLYGKDNRKIRHQKQKRKAFSDPVKKSVEEAGRSIEKTRRRVTTHLNKTDTLSEEDKDETETETETEKMNIRKQDLNILLRRHFQRQSDLIEKHRELAKKPIVPANPLLKRRIPSFLRVYSQASSSNDILLQWQLFNLSELESFYAMMTRLYKNENLARVQLYETYRTALLTTLTSKTLSNTNNENNTITTTL